jgi:hypothetical protein
MHRRYGAALVYSRHVLLLTPIHWYTQPMTSHFRRSSPLPPPTPPSLPLLAPAPCTLRLAHLALSLLNELTLGLVIAVYAGACASIPPRNLSAVADSPCTSGPPPAQTLVVPSVVETSDTWAWHPEPVRPGKGLGMKVARRP